MSKETVIRWRRPKGGMWTFRHLVKEDFDPGKTTCGIKIPATVEKGSGPVTCMKCMEGRAFDD